MLKQIGRPSPALIVSLIALFVALGGTVYAATGRINGRTIRVNSIPGNRLKPNTVTGKQVKESTLARVREARSAETSTNALNAVNAEKLDGRIARCPSGTRFFYGSCWESAPRGAASATVAAETCGHAGGALPGAFELALFSRQVALGGTGEWTDEVNTVAAENVYTVVTVSKAGAINFDASTDSKEYRCVLPLLQESP